MSDPLEQTLALIYLALCRTGGDDFRRGMNDFLLHAVADRENCIDPRAQISLMTLVRGTSEPGDGAFGSAGTA